MKIAYSHLLECINSNPSITEISDRLFQLGHEHELSDGIFDMEFTPNRGDCLSVLGLLRDLSVFYDTNLTKETYDHELDQLSINFINNAKDDCPQISFLKIDIKDEVYSYKGDLKKYFDIFGLKKNNFFTDVSNYIAYEMGQPTHCYDYLKVGSELSLKNIDENCVFETLLNKKIQLKGRNLVFLSGGNVINLAGVMGGKSTACSAETRSAIVECAYFNPESILGKTVKYDIQSDAAHKFERNIDINAQDYALRRFLKIITDHTEIKKVELFSQSYKEYKYKSIELNVERINKIIGIDISEKEYIKLLNKLGFVISENKIVVPSYRTDVNTNNDLAEEIARLIGYDNVPIKEIPIQKNHANIKNKIQVIKKTLIDDGFFEVINNPFCSEGGKEAISIDNPLDSNRAYLRTDLKKSLLDNLLYNERRQKDSVKLFEISNVYTSGVEKLCEKKVLAVIASGRVDKNFEDFTKKINLDYLTGIITELNPKNNFCCESIPRDSLDTKIKGLIVYLEIELENLNILPSKVDLNFPSSFKKYIPISEFPSSVRDISFSITNLTKFKDLEKCVLNFKHDLLKETYIFDYYENNKSGEVKLGFRFIFQSRLKTITDNEVGEVIECIIEEAKTIDSVSIPGI
jgi:phenylalanyl-tRNA synthetase beta chain